MSYKFDPHRLSYPQAPLWRMIIFLLLVLFLVIILARGISSAFATNPLLNGFILFVSFLGMCYAFSQVIQLVYHIRWVNNFRLSDPDTRLYKPPALLSPMANLLGRQSHTQTITPLALRSILDTISARLEGRRDILRYITGLLIFLGLLGTFWGLLQTISSVAKTLESLNFASENTTLLFSELKTALNGPLQGMGIAFSSSLFGLSASLVLGFLDLQTSQAQNLFYNELEDWLTTLTEIGLGDHKALEVSPSPGMQDAPQLLARIAENLEKNVQETTHNALSITESMRNLVAHLRHERDMMRIWADKNAQQNIRIERLLEHLSTMPLHKGQEGRSLETHSQE